MLIIDSFRPLDPVVPVFFPGALVLFMQQHGHSIERLLEGTGLNADSLEAPDIRVSFHTVRQIILNAEAAWAKPNLGLHFGASLSIPMLGLIGQAAFASNTLGEAMETIARYLALRKPLLSYSIERRSDATIFRLQTIIELGDVRGFNVDAAFSAAVAFLEQLAGRSVGDIDVSLRSQESTELHTRFLGKRVTFGASEDCFILPRDILDIPLATASPISAREARQYCDREMEQIGATISFGGVVQTLLKSRLTNIPTEAETARVLGHSTRNLRRRLASEELTYRGMVENIRRDSAMSLLNRSNRQIQDIAHELGYRNVGNFCRAFKRWTDHTPSEYRQKARSGNAIENSISNVPASTSGTGTREPYGQ